MKMHYFRIIGFLLVAISFATGCDLLEPVSTEGGSAINNDIDRNIVAALGRLEPQSKVVNVAPNPTISGSRIREILVEEGDDIRANQIIAILDDQAQRQAALTEAQQQVEIAKAKYAQVKAGAKIGEINAQKAIIDLLKAQNKGDVSAQNARIERLEAEVKNAEEEFKRYQTLFQEGGISESQLDSKSTIKEALLKELLEAQVILGRLQTTGQEEIRQAEANLERIVEIRPVDLAVAEAEINIANAAVDRAKIELDLSYVRAPIDGQILDVLVQAGELVGEEGVVTLGQTSQMYVIAEVYETDITRVKIGESARILSEYGGFEGELQGKIDFIGLQIHRNSLSDPNPAAKADARIVEVHVRIDPKDSERVKSLTNLQVRLMLE